MFCHKCGTKNNDDASFCNSCGTDLRTISNSISAPTQEAEPLKCNNCGTQIQPGQRFCSKCHIFAPWSEEKRNPVKSKHNDIINAKIITKKGELEDSGQTGPIFLIILGCIGLLAYGLGIILIIIGLIWSGSRNSTYKKIKNEIKELEMELEY